MDTSVQGLQWQGGENFTVALVYKLALPTIDPASDESGKEVYFGALRAADVGNLVPLTDLWLNRLLQGGSK